MKQGWTIETISSLCEQMNGIWKGEKEPLTTAKILRTTNFSKDCQMKLDDLAIIEVEQKKMEKRRLKKGDIIVEKSGGGPKQPVGRVILFNIDDDDFSFCNFTSALRIKDQTKILPEFLHKYLTYLYFSGETEKYQSNLVGFRNLDFKGYVSICVKYPSISEQQRIVALLDAEFAKIDALKANAERNLQNAKDLFQAALKKELEPKEGWEKSNVGATCSIISGYAFDSKGYSSNENDTLLLCGDNIVHCGFRWETIKRWNKDKYEELKRFAIQENDIVLAMDRPWVKSGLKIAKVSKNELPSLLIQRTACIRAKDGIVSDFIYYTLQDNAFSKYLIEQQTGVGVPHISGKQIMNYDISLPPHQDQQTIVANLDALNEKCKTLQANYEKTIALCDDLKQSLLRKVFKGEL